MLHLLEDVLGWVAVLVGSTIMYFTGRYWIDGVLVLGIAVFIVYNATNNLLDTMKILLQSNQNLYVKRKNIKLKVFLATKFLIFCDKFFVAKT